MSRRATSFSTRLLHQAADTVVHAIARVGYLTPRADPARYGSTLLRDVPYLPSRDRGHLLDVYVPHPARGEPDALRPVVVYVHGGGFAMLSKDTHRIMALPFAARGFTVFNVNYRLGRGNPYPHPLEDIAQALLWVRDNAARYRGDASQIVLAGESAGANLVTAVAAALALDRPEPFARALRDGGIKLRAALPIYGLLDVTDIDRFQRRRPLPPHIWAQLLHAAESYTGAPVRHLSAISPFASPLRLLEEAPDAASRHLPPFFIACGTRDPLLDDSRRLAQALGRLGVDHELVVHPGEIHGYNAMMWRPAARDMWQRLFSFLERRGAR